MNESLLLILHSLVWTYEWTFQILTLIYLIFSYKCILCVHSHLITTLMLYCFIFTICAMGLGKIRIWAHLARIALIPSYCFIHSMLKNLLVPHSVGLAFVVWPNCKNARVLNPAVCHCFNYHYIYHRITTVKSNVSAAGKHVFTSSFWLLETYHIENKLENKHVRCNAFKSHLFYIFLRMCLFCCYLLWIFGYYVMYIEAPTIWIGCFFK